MILARSKPTFIALLGVLLLPIISACFLGPSGEGKLGTWHWGRNLAIRVTEISSAEEVAYISDGQHFIIRPSSSEFVLKSLNIDIFQNGAAVLFVTPSGPNINLIYGDSKEASPVSLDTSSPTTAEVASTKLKIPTFHERVSIPKDHVISGWLTFEVPKDSSPIKLVWDEVDYVVLLLPED